MPLGVEQISVDVEVTRMPHYLVKHYQMFSTFSGALDMLPTSEKYSYSPENLLIL